MKTHIEHWGEAFEISRTSSLIEFGAACEKCGKPFQIGEYGRTRFGPRGGTNCHDDCTDAHTGDEEEVPD